MEGGGRRAREDSGGRKEDGEGRREGGGRRAGGERDFIAFPFLPKEGWAGG